MELINSLSFEETPVSIYGTPENPLFCADEIGKLFGVKRITSSILDYNSSQKILMNIQTSSGIQDKVFLTEIGLYKFLFTSRKEVALKFQEWVLNVIKELRLNGEYKLQSNKSQQPEIENIFLKMSHMQLRSKTLIDSNKNEKVVYICETDKKINGYPVIKIGKTDNVIERLQALTINFGIRMNYVYIFRCEKNYEFEQFLFKIPIIKENRYREAFENGKKSNEMFLLNDEFTYEKIEKIIIDNIEPFEKIPVEDKLQHKQIEFNIKKTELDCKMESIREKELEKEIIELKNENEKLKIMNQNSDLLQSLFDITKENNQMLKKLTNYNTELTIEEQLEKKSSSSTPYIQKYNEDLKLIGHYDSFIQMTRQIPGTSTHGLKCAIQNNSIYHGCRWAFLDKSQDPTIPQDLEPTKETNNRKYELLAHINLDKNKILKVYTEYSEMAKEYKASNSAISTARRRGTKCNGGYVVFYKDCEEELRKEYEENNLLPTKPISKTGTFVIQIDPITLQEISTYNSISDVTKKFKIGRDKLKEAFEKNTVFKGYKWIIS